MLISSPHYGSVSYAIMVIENNGELYSTDSPDTDSTCGFRPVVCLKSGTKLKKTGNNYQIIQ